LDSEIDELEKPTIVEEKPEAAPEVIKPSLEETIDIKTEEAEIIDTISDDAKRIDFDFFPTKDTITLITHLDVDGVLCVAAINKMLNDSQAGISGDEDSKKLRVFFTSPPKLFSTLAKSIPDLNKIDDDDFSIGELYISDLSLHRDTLLGSNIYDKVKWFDHHEVNPDEQYDSELDNVELIIDTSADSATSIICDHFKIEGDFGKIADEVDTNNLKSENAERIRNIIGGFRLKDSGSRLRKALFEFAQELAKDINIISQETYNQFVEEYTKWIDQFKNYTNEHLQTSEINGRKIGILETENAAPVFSIYDNLKNHPNGPFDIIAVLIHKYYRLGKDKNNKFKNKRYTKVEFRTHTDEEIIELSKLLGGGGHKYASGATIHDGLEKGELIKTIESHLTTSSGKK
jgi:oligoribonuclease NrnB/cAMP/cGMP phosphodiesterase (DHH superfamily)